MMCIKNSFVLLSFSVCFGLASNGFSQEATFESLIGEAKTAYESEDYPTAIDKLTRANWLQPNARLLLNIAKSYERSGNCVQGFVYYRAFVRAEGAEPSLVKEAQRALKKSAECDGWDDSLSGRVQVTSTPSGAAVSIDGNVVGTTPLEVAGLRDGEHTLVATLDGYDNYEQKLDAAPDADSVVAITLVKPAVVEETVTEEVEEPEETVVAVTEEPADKTVAYIIGGSLAAVGLGLVTVGAINDNVTIPDLDDQRRELDQSTSEFASLTEDRETAVTTALVGYIGGGVLLAGGVGYLVYTIMDTPEEPTYSLSPAVSSDHIGVTFLGRF